MAMGFAMACCFLGFFCLALIGGETGLNCARWTTDRRSILDLFGCFGGVALLAHYHWMGVCGVLLLLSLLLFSKN